MKIVTPQQMTPIEKDCAKYGISTATLMENAGLAIASEIRAEVGGVAGRRILVLAGRGANGGDGLVAAKHLARWGASVAIFTPMGRPPDDNRLAEALAEQAKLLCDNEARWQVILRRAIEQADVVIDAILGTGRSRPLGGVAGDALRLLNAIRRHKGKKAPLLVAVDLTSGVDALSGAADPKTPTADITYALGFPKTGHFAFPAAAHTGKLETLDIGIPSGLADGVDLELMTADWAVKQLPRRSRDGHKGNYGHVLVIGGSKRYPGAAGLATASALRSGAGLVTLACPRSAIAVATAATPEAIHWPLDDDDAGTLLPNNVSPLLADIDRYDALVIGCGIGTSPAVAAFVERFLLDDPKLPPTVIDADALNLLARTPRWHERLRSHAVLTPHPGEMSRLTALATPDVQAARIDNAREYADTWKQTVALKGAFTVIAAPDETCRLSPFANPIMASGGTGDALAGLIGGLLAQGLSPSMAASCGVYIHGAAAERLSSSYGDRGLPAGQLARQIPLTVANILAAARSVRRR